MPGLSVAWTPSGQPRPEKDVPCWSGWSQCAPRSRWGSPLYFCHGRRYGLTHGTLPFGFLLRTSAIQTSLIALGLASVDQQLAAEFICSFLFLCSLCGAVSRYSRNLLHKSTFISPKVHLPCVKVRKCNVENRELPKSTQKVLKIKEH